MKKNKELLMEYAESIEIKEKDLLNSIHITNAWDGFITVSTADTFCIMKNAMNMAIEGYKSKVTIYYNIYKMAEKFKSCINAESNLNPDKKNIGALESMEHLKEISWYKIEENLESLMKTEVIFEKMNNEVPEDYIEDSELIKEDVINNYEKIDINKRFEYEFDVVEYTKEEIVEKVLKIRSSAKFLNRGLKHNCEMYIPFVSKIVSRDVYIDFLMLLERYSNLIQF